MSDPRPGRAEAAAAIWTLRDASRDAGDREAKLRRQGLVRALVAALAATAFWLFDRWVGAAIAASLGAITLVLALASPARGYAALSRAVDRLGEGVALVLGWILLAPVFFLFVVPFGLLARRGSRDRLGRRFDRARSSYWQPRTPPRPGSLERPY